MRTDASIPYVLTKSNCLQLDDPLKDQGRAGDDLGVLPLVLVDGPIELVHWVGDRVRDRVLYEYHHREALVRLLGPRVDSALEVDLVKAHSVAPIFSWIPGGLALSYPRPRREGLLK